MFSKFQALAVWCVEFVVGCGCVGGLGWLVFAASVFSRFVVGVGAQREASSPGNNIMAYALDALPDCAALATPSNDWQWRNPTTSAPMLGDHSGEWLKGQLIAPPSDAASQPAWLARLLSWRRSCLQPLGLDTPSVSAVVSSRLYELPELKWTQHAYVHVQMHPYDLGFFDPKTGEYTVGKWLDDLTTRFGGIDAALIWPTYPQLGIDDRNAYEMIRSLPGGMNGLRSVVRQLHERHVKVLWPFMPWDTATRYEGPEPDAMLALVRDTGADGINGDTLYTMPPPFWEQQVASNGPYVALQAELGGHLGSLKYTTLGWGESGGWSLDLRSNRAPSVDLFKWLQPRRMTNICRRWDTDRNDALQHAWFNGIGYVAWENIWGCAKRPAPNSDAPRPHPPAPKAPIPHVPPPRPRAPHPTPHAPSLCLFAHLASGSGTA